MTERVPLSLIDLQESVLAALGLDGRNVTRLVITFSGIVEPPTVEVTEEVYSADAEALDGFAQQIRRFRLEPIE